MTIRAKSRRRLTLLLLVGLALVATGAGVYVHRERQLDAEAAAARTAGLAAFEQGEYGAAMAHLGKALLRLEPDPLTLRRYAQAIIQLPDTDPRHINSAIAALRRCTQMAPEDEDARRTLLKAYVERGALTEAVQLASWFLERDASDAQALLAKARALTQMRRFEQALAVLAGQIRPATPRIEEQLLYLSLMSMLKKPAAQIHARADQVLKAHPADRRFELVEAHARLVTGDEAGAREALARLVDRAGDDATFARLLLADLDTVGLPRESLAVLKTYPTASLERDLRIELVRRLWEAGEGATLPERVAAWNLELSMLPTPVLGYLALALSRLAREAEARAALDILARRDRQDQARAWTLLLRGVTLTQAPSTRARIAACRAALEVDPTNGPSRYELGLAYRDAGEDELAVQTLREAAARARGWAAPVAAGAGILIRAGRLPDAVAAAAEADALGSEDPSVALLLTLTRRAQGAAGGSYAERVLADLDRMALPPMTVLPVRLAMLTVAGREAEAGALIESALGAEEIPPGDLLLACADLSRSAKLGLDARCLERYEALHGNTPALALALAQRASTNAEPERGLAVLHQRRQMAGPAQIAGWDAAEAAYLEARGMADQALAAWRRATDEAPDDVLLLRRALGARSPWHDRAWVHGIIDLLRKATDDTCLWWRFYEARWLLSAPDPAGADFDAAIKLLKAVTEVATEQPEFHLLLASAHERQGRPQEALDELLIAKRNLNQSVGLELQVVRLYQDAGMRAAARDVLQQLLATGITRSDQLLAIATQLARLGERESVLEILERLSANGEDPADVQRRAELYASIGEFERAERLIQGALAKQEGPRALLLAAALAHFGGHPDKAEALLERFQAQSKDPLERERQLADHFRRVGDLGKVEVHLRRVVALGDVAETRDWLGLLSCLLLQGKTDALMATLRSPGAHEGEGTNPSLEEDLLRAAASREDLRRLGAFYVEDEVHRSAAGEAIRTLASVPSGAVLPKMAIDKLRALAREHPAFTGLQLATMETLASAGALQEAVDLGRVMMDRVQVSPEPARLLAYCYRAMKRPDLAADAARQWRSRTMANALEPDLFLAEQSAPEAVLSLLKHYVPAALRQGPAKVLVLYGDAMRRQGKHAELEALLRPHLASNQGVLRTWITLATLAARPGDAAQARAWLAADEIRAAEQAGVDLRVALAEAWQAVAGSERSEEARERARGLLASVTDLGQDRADPQGERRHGAGGGGLREGHRHVARATDCAEQPCDGPNAREPGQGSAAARRGGRAA